MIVVDGIYYLLFALFEYSPRGAADQVTGRQRSYLKTLAIAFQIYRLRVLQLRNLIERCVDVVQIE